MAYLRRKVSFRRISEERIAAWKKIPAATASDVMNRGQTMVAAIKSVTSNTSLCGQARTVQCMLGDNSILHYIASTADRGEVIVADAGGNTDVALWGDVTTIEGFKRKLGGLVLDGAVRDIKGSRDVGFPIFCRGIVPRGPHKAFGGKLDVAIACGGIAVNPGDLILGDEDGVVVVPLDKEQAVFERAMKHREKEDYWLGVLDSSEPLYKVLDIPEPEYMD